MLRNEAVIYSFCLYVLYVLLPLIPAILIFRLFPETKVTVSGPLQNLTVNATGAFAAYVVTVALGFFLVKNVEAQIQFSRIYAVQGVIVDLDNNSALDSDQFYSRYTTIGSSPSGMYATRDYYFVILLDHTGEKPETVYIKYWKLDTTSGVGQPPAPQPIPMKLGVSSPALQRFRLRVEDGHPVVVPDA